MSLKLVLFESLGAVSYSPSIVTVAVSVTVCEIFSVREWRDLENQVRCRSRSLKMAPFDRPYATFYRSATVNIALSCTTFIQKLRYGFLFAFYSKYGRICNRL